jgi:hypothetical protein
MSINNAFPLKSKSKAIPVLFSDFWARRRRVPAVVVVVTMGKIRVNFE